MIVYFFTSFAKLSDLGPNPVAINAANIKTVLRDLSQVSTSALTGIYDSLHTILSETESIDVTHYKFLTDGWPTYPLATMTSEAFKLTDESIVEMVESFWDANN